jgi:VanZ family protein
VVLGAVVVAAAISELLQLLRPGRHAKVGDALRKMVGGALGVFIGNVIVSFAS